MQKSSTGYLENLYHGPDAARLSFPEAPPVDEEKIRSFIARFNEAMTGFDPRGIEERHSVPPELMDRLKAAGMFGLCIPREYGGLGFTLTEYLSAIRQISEADLALALIPLAHLSIGVMGIILFGSVEQKKRYLPKAASGEMIFAYALTEPDTGSDAQHIQTGARPEGDCWVLDGTKTYITNANYAGAFSVFARTDLEKPGALGMFVVERSWSGVSVGPDMPKMGLAVSSTAAVRLNAVKVPRGNLVGDPGDGFKIAMTILNYGRLGLGAGSAGLLALSLRDMSRRAAARKQFGAPIRDFPLVQEKLVQARAHGFAVSAMTSFTAALLYKDPLMNVAMESSHCKLYGTTRCWDTLYDALQVAGGAGYLSTLPYEKRMRDFRVTTIFEGTTEIHSVYPPLALFRLYGKELAARGPLGKLAGLGKITRTRAMKGMRERSPILREALGVAARGEALFRALLGAGLRYGSRIVQEEFHLRRMTNLSMSLFWLVASIWEVKRGHPDADYPREDLDVIAYLTEEAREEQARDGFVGRSRKESIHGRIIRAL